MKPADSPRADALHSADESLALRSRASGFDTDHSRLLAAWLIHPTPQCIKFNSRRARPRRVTTCLYSLGLRSPSRLSLSALCPARTFNAAVHPSERCCLLPRSPLIALSSRTCRITWDWITPSICPEDCPRANLANLPCSVACEDIKSLILCCGNEHLDWGLPGNWLGRYHLVFGLAS
jgi:hypothetical protein